MHSGAVVLGVIGGIVAWLLVQWRAKQRRRRGRQLAPLASSATGAASRSERPVHLSGQERDLFGPVAECLTLQDVFGFIRALPATDEESRRKAAAYGLVLVAGEHVIEGSSFFQGRDAIDALSRAKCELDLAFHDYEMARVSSSLLLEAQRIFDEAMIPCTEWASTEEIWRAVLTAATRGLANS